jgi:hypothetical protein
MSGFQKITTQEEIFRRKAASRRISATQPIEEKIKTLVKIQQMTSAVARAAGRDSKQPWNIKLSKQYKSLKSR